MKVIPSKVLHPKCVHKDCKIAEAVKPIPFFGLMNEVGETIGSAWCGEHWVEKGSGLGEVLLGP